MEFNNFKAPYPPRRATNQNNTRSTFNNGVLSDTYNDFKQVEERYQVLKKICPPEDVAEILRETVNHLNAAVYEKMAERLNVRSSNSQAPSVGGSSIYSFNPRPTVPSSAVSDYCPRPPQESTRRRTNSTAASKNYGLTNTLVPNRHTVLSTDQFSAANEIIYEVEPSVKTHPNKQIPTKNPTFTFGFAEKQPVDGLSIPITKKKPNPPVSQPKRPTKKTTELAVVPSDDESDISIFGTTRRVGGKEAKTEKPTNTRAHNLSVSLKRIPVDESTSRKRKASQEDIPLKKKSPPEVETRPSPDTTTSNVATGKPSKPANETLRRTTRNVSIRKQETAAKSKENKENKKVKAKTQKEARKPKAKTPPVVDEAAEETDEEVFDEGAFFGDVSSIVGSDSLALTNTIKNTTKHSAAATLVPLHSFSPFANIRSTSGVSAISTPLSKSLAKNVLGKRIKKPSVLAELKNVHSRKPRKDVVQAVVAVPAPDVSEESDGETSDFST